MLDIKFKAQVRQDNDIIDVTVCAYIVFGHWNWDEPYIDDFAEIESATDAKGSLIELNATQRAALESEAIERVYEQMSATQEDY